MVIHRRSLLLAGVALPVMPRIARSQCVTDTPSVDACRGGVRITAALPPGATLDLSFLTPGTLDPRITFTRASTATYFDATGTMQTAAVNTPRWDSKGLLIEDARTNLVLNSVNLAGWSLLQVAWAQNAGPAPDGTNSSAKLTEDGTNNFHTMIQTFTVTASAALTFSLHAKAVENRYLIVAIDNNASVGATATFDLQTGTVTASGLVGTGTYIGASMQPVGNGVYRCSISGTIGASTTCRAIVSLTNSPALGTFPGYQGVAGRGVLFWGGQLEQGGFPTSYIGTTGATVTRAFDSCFIAPASMSPWFASPGGSWMAEFVNVNPAADRSSRIIGIHDASGITPIRETTAYTIDTFDGTQLATANTVTTGAVSKGASTYVAGNAKICLNGGTVVAGALGAGFATLATTGIGILGGNPGVVNESMTGYIRRVRYWPRVLTNAEMQSVTT